MSSYNVDWVAAAVESIRSPHVKKMTLQVPGDLAKTRLPGAVYTQWPDLDRALVKYLTARPFKLKVIALRMDKATFEVCVGQLLPHLFVNKMLEVACRNGDLEI